jgi:hypothetical protein
MQMIFSYLEALPMFIKDPDGTFKDQVQRLLYNAYPKIR